MVLALATLRVHASSVLSEDQSYSFFRNYQPQSEHVHPVFRSVSSAAGRLQFFASSSLNPVRIDAYWMEPRRGQMVGDGKVAVPILMYHYIQEHDDRADPRGAALYLPPDAFKAQIEWLVNHGYHTIDFDDFVAAKQKKSALLSKPVILTFDDGYEDAYTQVLPVLERARFKGVFYIVSGFIGSRGYLTEKQIIEMDKKGMMIATHTVSHLDLRSLPPRTLVSELEEGRKTLEALLGHPIVHFAYPAGKYSTAIRDRAAAAGYLTAVTTKHGRATGKHHFLELPRIRMTKEVSMAKMFP